MLIAHLPAAYLALRALPRRLTASVFLIGAVLPDIDMLWFYTLGERAAHHHSYITHRPALWFGLAALGWALRRRMPAGIVTALALGALLHLALDSITGQIAWGWPVSTGAAPLVEVPATRAHWVLSFMAHWTFILEIALTLAAALALLHRRKNPAT